MVNAIIWLPTRVQILNGSDPRDSILAIATGIRASIAKLKNPGFIEDMAAGVAKIQSEVSWAKACQDIATAKEGHLIVNNIWK